MNAARYESDGAIRLVLPPSYFPRGAPRETQPALGRVPVPAQRKRRAARRQRLDVAFPGSVTAEAVTERLNAIRDELRSVAARSDQGTADRGGGQPGGADWR